jgi:hypothetical protein
VLFEYNEFEMKFNRGDSCIRNEYVNSLKYMLTKKYLYGTGGIPVTGSSIRGAHAIEEAGKRNLAYNELR